MKLLHVHAQGSFHDDVYIYGNREALEALASAIQLAIVNRVSMNEFFVNDGEGFRVIVIHNDAQWEDKSWTDAATPYIDDFAAEQRKHAVWPLGLLTAGERKRIAAAHAAAKGGA